MLILEPHALLSGLALSFKQVEWRSRRTHSLPVAIGTLNLRALYRFLILVAASLICSVLSTLLRSTGCVASTKNEQDDNQDVGKNSAKIDDLHQHKPFFGWKTFETGVSLDRQR